MMEARQRVYFFVKQARTALGIFGRVCISNAGHNFDKALENILEATETQGVRCFSEFLNASRNLYA